MTKHSRKLVSLLVGASVAASFAHAADGELQKVMKARGLSEIDVVRAAKTYNPSGGRDEFVVFSSAGQAGQVIVYRTVVKINHVVLNVGNQGSSHIPALVMLAV